MKNQIYSIGRVCAVITRPACLYLVNNYLAQKTAEGLSEVFLISALIMGLISADPHRRFYQIYFSPDADNKRTAFYNYLSSLVLLVAIGCILIFTMVGKRSESFFFAIACILYFISEKLADEILRFNLFNRDLDKWGRLSGTRSILQILTVIILIGAFKDFATSEIIIIFWAAIGFSVYVKELPSEFLRWGCWQQIWLVIKLFPNSIKLITTDWELFAMTIVAAAIRYLDRLIVLFIDKSLLPLFTLVGMCFSIVPLAVDFFYVSPHRRDFLEQKLSIKNAFLNIEFIKNICMGVMLAGITTVIVLHFSVNSSSLPIYYIVVVAIINISLSLILVPEQILYWRHSLRIILSIDLTFWMLFGIAILSAWKLNLSSEIFFSLLTICTLIRLGLYLFSASLFNASVED
jgi:hypothetical protein